MVMVKCDNNDVVRIERKKESERGKARMGSKQTTSPSSTATKWNRIYFNSTTQAGRIKTLLLLQRKKKVNGKKPHWLALFSLHFSFCKRQFFKINYRENESTVIGKVNRTAQVSGSSHNSFYWQQIPSWDRQEDRTGQDISCGCELIFIYLD